MRTHRNILLFLFFGLVQNLSAQTNNYWVNIADKTGFKFDTNGLIQIVNGTFNDKYYCNFSIAGFDSKPLLYSVSDETNSSIYNVNGNKVSNSDGVFCANLFFGYSSPVAMLDTSSIMVFGMLRNNWSKIYLSFLDVNKNDPSGFDIKSNFKNVPYGFKDSIVSVAISRNNNANPLIVIRTIRNFYSCKINIQNRKLIIVDSLYHYVQNLVPDSLYLNPILSPRNRFSGYLMRFSNSGSQLAFLDGYTVSTKFAGFPFIFNHFYRSINLLNIDKNSLRFISTEKIYEDYWNSSVTGKLSMNFILNCAFSPDDSKLYFINHERLITGGINPELNYSIKQFNLNNKFLNEVYKFEFLDRSIATIEGAYFQLNSKGELFYFEMFKENNSYRYWLNKIKFPNLDASNCDLQIKTQSLPMPIGINNPLPSTPCFDFIRVSKQIEYKCDAKVELKNGSLKDIDFSEFTWHIQTDTGILYHKGYEPPILIYKINGVYPYKLFAHSAKNEGYGEWFIDTIVVEIPEKPHVNFYSDDTVSCRQDLIGFKNYSNSKQIINETYSWHFGDGNTSNLKSPTHKYNLPGRYTISLFYSNGYCDSTLVKNQYISIVDAPDFGFLVDKTNGCTPLTITITDTIKRFVRLKEYDFEGNGFWSSVPISTAIIKHTFLKPGKYLIRQRLAGFSTCITQKDSVFIYVSPGITKGDSVHVYNSSIENNSIEITWNKHPNAIAYHVYRDGVAINTTSDTFLQIFEPYKHESTFEIQGFDSCGGFSSFGRIGKPVFLTAEMIGINEQVKINFSAYLKWINGVSYYSIQKLIGQNWVEISSSNMPITYFDSVKYIKGQLGCSYRIEAISKDGVKSHSNTVYVEYLPNLFVPNAFTPNNDNLNDVLNISEIGISNYEYKIFNRWGELINVGTNLTSWDGSNASQGLYLIVINYTTTEGLKGLFRTTISLLR